MKPVVVLVPQPQPVERIFSPEALAALRERFEVVEPEGDAGLDAALPDAVLGIAPHSLRAVTG